MVDENIKKLANQIQSIFDNKQFDKFIHDITFPRFKKFSAFARLEFRFPITIIVGPNGGGKSSVLHALWGMPERCTTRDFWFSTPVDPIENGKSNPNRYWYSHYIKKIDHIAQSKKTSGRKKTAPDYWEPDEPRIKDRMNKMPPITKSLKPYVSDSGDRWNQVERKRAYANSKAESSAFDRFFNHVEFERKAERQKYFTKWSGGLKKTIDKSETTYYKRNAKVNFMVKPDNLAAINKILGKNYNSAHYLIHNFYDKNVYSSSVIFETSTLTYSECFAGSGELAVVNLVLQISDLDEFGLLLLDEPETSLHPGAQVRLIEYLLEVTRDKKIQVVISTHSPTFVDYLPTAALIILDETDEGINPRSVPSKELAFYSLGKTEKDKVIILTEDALIQALVERVIHQYASDEVKQKIIVKAASDGATMMLSNHARSYMLMGNRVIMIVDGDMNDVRDIFKADPKSLSHQDKLSIIDVLKKHKPAVNITGSSHDENSKIELLDAWMVWCNKNVLFIDYVCPEELFIRLYDPGHQLAALGGSNGEFKSALKSILEMNGEDSDPKAQSTLLKSSMRLALTSKDHPEFARLKAFAERIVLAVSQIDGAP